MKTFSIEKCLRHLEELNNENFITYNEDIAKEIVEARQELKQIKEVLK